MEAYEICSDAGSGSYGEVYKVKSRSTGQLFALKQYRMDTDESTVRELSCLSALRHHPNVIQILDCVLHNGKICMLMPYTPHTLAKAIFGRDLNCTGRLMSPATPLSFVAHFSLQVANALSYMHRLNFIHRDLTPWNVLLTDDLTVKVADMGLSRQSSTWMSSTVVALPYRAPELFSAEACTEYTCTIDMWSLGVMIADATEGSVVFLEREGMSTHKIILQTMRAKDHPDAAVAPWDLKSIMPNVMKCDAVKRIVFRLLNFPQNKRLLAHELLQDTEWIQAARLTRGARAKIRGRLGLVK